LPPENGDADYATDEEDISESEELPETAGEAELDMEDTGDDSDEDDAQPNPTGRWTKKCSFNNPLPDEPCDNLLEKHPELLIMSEYELWSTFFDESMLNLLHVQTTLYARRDKNIPTFQLSIEEMKKFLGIVLLSGYHSLPSERDYWSRQPDLQVPLVAKAMSRDRYCQIKSCLHLADNHDLQKRNIAAKVTPLYNRRNKNLKKRGIFLSELSIDESMVPS
jgi:hypothetical protein